MTTQDLRALALAATRGTVTGGWSPDYIRALSPDVVLALLDVAEAAEAFDHDLGPATPGMIKTWTPALIASVNGVADALDRLHAVLAT
jgi:hypothetical protein